MNYSGNGFVSFERENGEDEKVALYQIGVENLWGDAKSVDLIWHYLVHDKEIRSKRSTEAIEKLKAEIATLIEQIEMVEGEDRFPARESELCSWCEYQTLCPRHKHIVATSEMPVNKFLKDPGVKLVNRYARLVDEKRAFLQKVEDEMTQLKEAIIAYAKKEEVEVIRGSDKKLSVKIDTKAKFPTKEEEERAELDALLKSAGKWTEISDLNVYALARAMQRGEWSSELVEKIEKFQRLEEQYRLTLSVLREEE
ncbi:MAG: PD-(D/E)XK nuclease family protein [Methanobacteriota archaeon]